MDRREAIGILGLAGVASLQAAPSARDRFPGIYKLVSWKTTNADGSITEPMGPDPMGRITYHKSGHMSVQLWRRDRQAPARINLQTATADELREALRQMQTSLGGGGFVAYMGAYTVHEDRSIVVHHLEGGSSPTFTGQDFERHYEITDKGIILSVPPQLNSKLQWDRVADA